MPGLAIELVCRKVNDDVRRLHRQLWPRILFVKTRAMLFIMIDQLGTASRHEWHHHHIQHIVTRRPPYLIQDTAFNSRNLRYVTIYEPRVWHDRDVDDHDGAGSVPVSLEVMARDFRNDTSGWMELARHHGNSVQKMCGGRGLDVALTLVGEPEDKVLDAVVEIVSPFHRSV